MTLVHPPARSILLSTVAIELVVVIVPGTEVHAIVGCEKLVTGIITKIVAVEGIPGISANEVGIGQAVFVGFRTHPEHGIVRGAVRMEWRISSHRVQRGEWNDNVFCNSKQYPCAPVQITSPPPRMDLKSLQQISEKLKATSWLFSYTILRSNGNRWENVIISAFI